MKVWNPWFEWMSFFGRAFHVGRGLAFGARVVGRGACAFAGGAVGWNVCSAGDRGVLDFAAVGAESKADAGVAVG